MARAVALQATVSTDGFKTGMDLCCNAALKRLEDLEAKSKNNVDRIVESADRRQNETIRRNGVSSKEQRLRVEDLVSICEARVHKQNKVMNKM